MTLLHFPSFHRFFLAFKFSRASQTDGSRFFYNSHNDRTSVLQPPPPPKKTCLFFVTCYLAYIFCLDNTYHCNPSCRHLHWNTWGWALSASWIYQTILFCRRVFGTVLAALLKTHHCFLAVTQFKVSEPNKKRHLLWIFKNVVLQCVSAMNVSAQSGSCDRRGCFFSISWGVCNSNQKDTAENVVRELKSRKGGQEKLGTNKKWKNVNEIKKRGQVTVWIP